mgnify:CR=1
MYYNNIIIILDNQLCIVYQELKHEYWFSKVLPLKSDLAKGLPWDISASKIIFLDHFSRVIPL